MYSHRHQSFRRRSTRRLAFEPLESRRLLTYGVTVLPNGSLEIMLDDSLDQFGFQPAIVQAYDSTPDNGFDDALGAFSIFDTGASVVTFGANDQLLFSLVGGGGTSGIPIQVPCGAVAEGVGGLTLVGHISQPGTVLADGLHVSTLSFDEDGFPVFELGFNDPVIGTVADPLPGGDGFLGNAALSGNDDFYNGSYLAFTSGDLRGQIRQINDYGGAARSFVFSAPFAAEPAGGDGFVIVQATPPLVVESASSQVIDSTPAPDRFSGAADLLAQDNYYEGQYVQFTTGALSGQIQQIAEYVGASRTLVFSSPFAAVPVAGDAFRILKINTTPAAIVGGIQAFLGAYVGAPPDGCPAPASEALPTIAGTPMLRPTADHPQGLAANIRPSGALMDFSDFAGFEGLVIPIPDVHFQDPGLGIPDDPIATVDDGAGGTRSIRTDPVRVELDFLGAEVDELGKLSEGYNPVQSHVTVRHNGVELVDQVFLFDTGAQLSVISEAQAMAFGLDAEAPEDTISIQGAGGVIADIPGYKIDSIAVPLAGGQTLTFQNVWVFVIDAAAGLIDGILGMNLFNNAAAMLYDPYHPAGPSLELSFFTELPYVLPYAEVEEFEPNDTPDEAAALRTGQYGAGAVSAADVDFWGTPGSSVGDLLFAYVDVQDSAGVPAANLEILANDRSLLAADQNDGPGGGAVVAGVSVPAGQAGNVYYRVNETSGAGISRYQLYTAIVDPLDAVYEGEPGTGVNDTMATATLVTKRLTTGKLASGDIDYFALLATAGSRIVVMMDHNPDGDGLLTSTSLSLLAPDGSEVFPSTEADGDGNANAIGAVVSVPTSGTYYLKIAAGPATADDEYRFVALVLDGGSELLSAQLIQAAEARQSQAEAEAAAAEQQLTDAWTAYYACGGDPFCELDALIEISAAQNAYLEAELALLEISPQTQYLQAFAGTIGVGKLPSFELGSSAQVVDRHVFYNNSAYDGNDPAANASDFSAIAPHTPVSGGHGPHPTGKDQPALELGKDALLPGQTATFANYTSYSRGINGIMVDIAGLTGTPTTADFQFLVGNHDDPATWAAAPTPASITVFPRAGTPDGVGTPADRVTIIWADNAIENTWLQITVLATAATGLTSPDVFYFGNAVGDSGAGNTSLFAFVTVTDELTARGHPHNFLNPASITDPCDFNKDSFVTVSDELAARNHGTNFLNALRLITVPAPPAGGADMEQFVSAGDWLAASAFEDAAGEGIPSEISPSPTWPLRLDMRLAWGETPQPTRRSAAAFDAFQARSVPGTFATRLSAADQMFAQLGAPQEERDRNPGQEGFTDAGHEAVESERGDGSQRPATELLEDVLSLLAKQTTDQLLRY